MTNVITVGIVAAALSWVSAQDRKPDIPTGGSSSAITLSGCLRGSVLELQQQGVAKYTASSQVASEYHLEGAKDLMQMLKSDHDGHFIEVTGVARIPPPTTDEQIDVKTTELGRAGRVTIGSRQQKGFLPTPPRPIRLVVETFKHLGDSCARR